MEKSKLNMNNVIIGAAFTFYFLIALHKLTHASLWFDEAVEYWFSKIMFGEIPFLPGGVSSSTNINMYNRIVSTFQPPLYNFLMYFWLKINESVWWFRFFGIVMGFVGLTGIFKSVKMVTDNVVVAAGAVLFSSCVFRLVYYWQEAGEYCLMLGSLCWVIYYWICLIKETSRKNIICFTIASIIAVYSQYGSGFPVIIMILTALITVLLKKDKRLIFDILSTYTSALFFAALPLYFLFVKKQLLRQQGGAKHELALINNSIISDLWTNSIKLFQWNIAPNFTEENTILFLILVLSVTIVAAFHNDKITRWLIAVNILTFLIYYLAVKYGFYAYGRFGNRYNLFFIPLWIITIFIALYEFYEILRNQTFAKWDINNIYLGVSICLCVCYCYFSWTTMIQNNWRKEENRAVVEQWYRQQAYKANTLVYYCASPGFSYYVRHNKAYSKSAEDKVIYTSDMRKSTEKEIEKYLNGVYNKEWPKELYISATHIGNDLEIILKLFRKQGYKRKDIYNNHGKLIKLVK